MLTNVDEVCVARTENSFQLNDSIAPDSDKNDGSTHHLNADKIDNSQKFEMQNVSDQAQIQPVADLIQVNQSVTKLWLDTMMRRRKKVIKEKSMTFPVG